MSTVAEQIQRTLCYKSEAVPDSIRNDISLLRAFDAEQEKRVRKWAIIGGVGAAFVFFGIFIGFGTGLAFGLDPNRTPGKFFAVAGIVPFCGLVSAITGFILWRKNRKLDLDNRRYEFIDGLMNLLRTDMAPDAKVAVNMDLRPHNHGDKFDRKAKVGDWNAKFYVDPWLKIQGRFVDGTRYTVSMLEKQQDRSKWKTNARGKTKYKSKKKNASEAVVTLKVKPEKYPHLKNFANDMGGAIQLPNWTAVKSVSATADSLTLRATTRIYWGITVPGRERPSRDAVQWLAMMLLSLYQGLNLSRTIDKSKS